LIDELINLDKDGEEYRVEIIGWKGKNMFLSLIKWT